jgi:uncharacterized protein (DUF2384 family)
MAPRQPPKTAKRPAVMAAGAAAGPSEFVPVLDEVATVRRAAEVLGVEHVARWMQSRIPSLGNQTPYVLIKTEDGRSQIERVLCKIEHGVY